MGDYYHKGPSPIKIETGLTSSLSYIAYELGLLTRHHHNRRYAEGDGGPLSGYVVRHANFQVLYGVDSHPLPDQCYQFSTFKVSAGLLSFFHGITTVRMIHTVPSVPPLFTHLLTPHFRAPTLPLHPLLIQELPCEPLGLS